MVRFNLFHFGRGYWNDLIRYAVLISIVAAPLDME